MGVIDIRMVVFPSRGGAPLGIAVTLVKGKAKVFYGQVPVENLLPQKVGSIINYFQ